MSRTNTKRGAGRPRGRPGPPPFEPTADAVVADTKAFVEAATHLFGPNGWIREIARRMAVNETTVWRWVNASPVPPGPALSTMTAWVRLSALGQPTPPDVGQS